MESNWFDSLLVSFADGEPDEVVFRVARDGGPEYNVVIPLASTHSAKFWDEIRNNLGVRRQPFPDSELTCPVCNAHRHGFLRMYGSWHFCGFCGSHLDLTDGILTIIAKTYQM